jgi:hypothetical protein
MTRRRTIDTTPIHRKLGYEHAVERQRIRAHLIRRGHDPHALAFEFRVTRIQDRIAKYKPTFRQRQDAARERGEKWVATHPVTRPTFDRDELLFLIEHFEGANHPLAQSVYTKAVMMMETL